VWSDDEDRGLEVTGLREAKLGGTGLGLVALTGVERVRPQSTPREDLRALGRFLLFMQKPDGSFHSKYLAGEAGRDDRWTSLYYPGEAALGLVSLYELDGAAEWLRGAEDALAHLARSRRGQAGVPADHWALLATARLLELRGHDGHRLPGSEMVEHAAQICRSVLAEHAARPGAGRGSGALTGDGRTCPTATRVEGLLAALTFLPAEHADLRRRIETAVQEAVEFLLRAQIVSGEHAGGMPEHVIMGRGGRRPAPLWGPDPPVVRIDDVQHALSAMLQYVDAAGATRVPWR